MFNAFNCFAHNKHRSRKDIKPEGARSEGWKETEGLFIASPLFPLPFTGVEVSLRY